MKIDLKVPLLVLLFAGLVGDGMTKENVGYKSIFLKDVQGLFGGQNVYISFDGGGYVQRVKPGLKEKRYELNLTPGDQEELKRLIEKAEFATLKIPERAGVPDEAHPTIVLMHNDGTIVTVSKWINDRNERFDAVYAWLMREVRRTEGKKTVYQGRYNPELEIKENGIE